MIDNTNGVTSFPHGVLLTNRQVANIRTGFGNNFVINIKLSKIQTSKFV